ncbi:hypothetical protein [Nocardiopsis ansamitocini]|uniref:Uncharacterized protein n=1 Tax=Nocardiopsis ansamitocini TaxID=1670832 RepID=A0A9W6P7W9_9ACTN|nr:hypothetical protein [Nocardiopsis ansamitocini]GLU48810.1 hypothetical protein Nans01_31610 [Nocardiopsis ansamitocini]
MMTTEVPPIAGPPTPDPVETAFANLFRALRAKGVTVRADTGRSRLSCTAGTSVLTVVLRGRWWLIVWPDGEPDPILPVGQEWRMAERVRAVLRIGWVRRGPGLPRLDVGNEDGY